ncbi:MAG TPA: YtxH domain-containing protein [Nitrospirota bacterium]|nr:YtxH domain-containing protein [Nitrospirota bacterium]
MKEDIVKDKKEISLFVPFLVGGLVGAGVALLLAPKSGKELRKDIKGLAADTREVIASSIAKGKDLYEGSKTAVKTAIDAGKTAYVEERDRIRHAAA